VSDGGTCRCGARWTGRRTAHCGACHRTFGGVGGFDAHRRGGRGCLEPTTVGLELRNGAFRGPQLDVETLERLERYN
jgi:hypothetical protein